MLNVIHVTHEAVHKMGGIGTVLEGLINSRPYQTRVNRTVLVCPMFDIHGPERLGPDGEVEYSSLDRRHDGPYADAFKQIETDYHVHIAYGKRKLEDSISGRSCQCEVLLIDIRHIRAERINQLKARLWELHGLQSHRHEHVWDFEQYMRLAAPATAALEAMGLAGEEAPAVVFAHEFMGVPTALALTAEHPGKYRSLFHAHEVATVRPIVEQHSGHDVMFYNVLNAARSNGLFLPDVFGPQHGFFKHALIETTRNFDGILAVGHHVVDELRFLGPAFAQADISLAYNGVPSQRISLEDKTASKALVLEYCRTLLGWQPEWIFTHVTRLARSKALWRDLDVLEAFDEELVRRNQRAVFFVLATELPRRATEDILRMEHEWNWPLAHREGLPDLTEGEAEFYRLLHAFNLRSRNVRTIYMNQFGFENPACGVRMPVQMRFSDIRRATDLEFGMSCYEPFGISPLEPLTFGGLCVISTSCGCAGFVNDVSAQGTTKNVLLADFVQPAVHTGSVGDAIEIDSAERRRVERNVAKRIAEQIARRLPATDAEQCDLIQSGYELAERMSWDVVAGDFIMPAVERVRSRRAVLRIA